ncbi:MAG: nuclease-related domain-containing protein [Candidatus Altiarchaeota archaeon]
MKILKKNAGYVWRNIQLVRSRVFLFLALLLLGFMLLIINIFPYATIGTILIILSYFLGVYTYQKYLTWKSSESSEELIINELKKLPDNYMLISNVVIPPNRGDTDHIVLGPNGIFVIEAKHYGGEIKCDGDKWQRYKISKSGTKYLLWAGSPSAQVKRNAKVLKDFLLKHKEEIFKKEAPHIWIESILIFTNERAKIQVKNPTVKILKIYELSDFILSSVTPYNLKEEEIERISSVILKNSRS